MQFKAVSSGVRLNKKSNFWQIPLLILLAVTALVTIYAVASARSRLHNMELASMEATEYRARIIADNLTNNLNRVDTLLRISAGIISDERPVDTVAATGVFERRILDELLLMPEVGYIVLLSPDRKRIWHSPGFPVGDNLENYSSSELNRPGAKYQIGVHRMEGEDQYHIHMSRAIRNSQGNLVAIVEAVCMMSSLLPSKEEPLLREVVRSGVYSADGRQLFERTEKGYAGAAEDWVRHQMVGERDAASVSGGSVVDLYGDNAVSVYSIQGFPFQVFVVSDISTDKQVWLYQTMQAVVVLFALGVLAAFISYYFQVKRNALQISLHADELQEVNQQLLKTNHERELLLKEIHHRVKNSLSLISSIISLVSMGGGPFTAQTLNDLQARILAVQDVHNALYKSSDLTSISAFEYIRGLVETILASFCSFPVNLDCQIDPFQLNPRQAVSFGLVSSEIVTNAIKYGLEPNGTLRIRGKLDAGFIQLTIANNGKPYEEGSKGGLGTMLINSLVEQHKGRLSLETSGETKYTLLFPLENQEPD